MVASLVSGVTILWFEAKRHLGLAIKNTDLRIDADEGGFMQSWGRFVDVCRRFDRALLTLIRYFLPKFNPLSRAA